MRTRLLSTWESIHTGFWFIPALMTVGAIVLSVLMLWLDEVVSFRAVRMWELIYPGSAQGARLLLSTIAGSVITVTAATFSITIVALTLASSQFGPRVLRNFMADRGNQTVLGTFVATFIYCLLILRVIRGGDENDAVTVPRLAVTVGIVLALISFSVLIYFFHHAASSLQVERLVDSISRELLDIIENVFPEEPPDPPVPEQTGRLDHSPDVSSVSARRSGYLRSVELETLLHLAGVQDLVIQVERRPGDFITEQSPLAQVAGTGRNDPQVHEKIEQAFILGPGRTLEQDAEFPVQQLIDIALRALSPSLNDAYTAVVCIDRLGAALCHLNSRQSPPRYRQDREGRVRLILDTYTYEGMVDVAFDQIRQSAAGSVSVCIHLLEVLRTVAATTRTPEQRQVIRRHVEMIHRAGLPAAQEKKDRDDLEERFQAAVRELENLGG
jgi:uncharacterized membrane protein